MQLREPIEILLGHRERESILWYARWTADHVKHTERWEEKVRLGREQRGPRMTPVNVSLSRASVKT